MKRKFRLDTFLEKVSKEFENKENHNLPVYVRKDGVSDTIQKIAPGDDNGRGIFVQIISDITNPNTMTLKDVYLDMVETAANRYIFTYSPVMINWNTQPSDFYLEDGAFYIE